MLVDVMVKVVGVPFLVHIKDLEEVESKSIKGYCVLKFLYFLVSTL